MRRAAPSRGSGTKRLTSTSRPSGRLAHTWATRISPGFPRGERAQPDDLLTRGCRRALAVHAEPGRLYGLTVDRGRERLEPQRSTDEANRYVRGVHQGFGNWELAMAAYNTGQAGLARAIRKFNTNDFWELATYEAGIPWETTLYVPKIMAHALVMTNPAAFGLENVARDVPSEFDVVRVPAGFPLRDIAKAAELPETAVTGINPELLAGRAPPAPPGAAPRTWSLRVPAGTGAVVTRKLAPAQASANVEPYVVRFGDTTAAIAHERGVDERTIRQLNSIGTQERLERGTVPVPRRTEAWCRPSRAWR